MKKIILFLVFSIAISGSLFAQKNQDKKIEKKINAYIKTIESKKGGTIEISSSNALTKYLNLYFLDINIYALDGRLVSSQQRYMQEGAGRMDIKIDGAASGLYYCSVSSSSWRVTLKLVKVQ